MAIRRIDLKSMDMNPFRQIGDEWMLITAEKEGKVNTMTASWGGVGVLWGKDVATVYIRPQRYTKEFVDAGDSFTLSFFGGAYKKEMAYLGRVSGRDEDKIAASGLTVEHVNGYPTFAEAKLILVCRKMYCDEIRPENFLDRGVEEKCYPEKDYHTMYIAEIAEAYAVC